MSWDESPYYETSFGVHKSRRYHAKMRDFYRSTHQFILLGNIVFSSVAFASAMWWWPGAAAALSALVALASTADYFVKTEKVAAQYDDLCRRFTNLAEEIERWKPTPENLREAKARRLSIEADEPTCKQLVEIWADGEETRARGGDPTDIPPLCSLQRRLGPIATFGMPALERWHAERERQRSAGDT
ncbi:hypothetical protein [Hyphomicrobium sp. CS1BSMeth3]|uniref:hypothetical protein n=1 Tax=Hyphomicrobium sp. CS1BSMeth3 TaxID=1892844 RepID=UPI0009314116|nr:hypothetical protein [Hyphomicrobium sp. CS1BSMeth3]